MMMYITDVQWKDDFVTRAFLREHGEDITDPGSMEVSELAGAVTYCKTVDNPYSREIVKRSGALEDFNHARALKDKNRILRTECEKFGIRLY